MSMYNLVFGHNPMSHVILAALGLKAGQVGRFRDAFVAGGEIAVYTRNGGSNRGEHLEEFEALRRHPCYLRDVDDTFDNTYCTIYFRFPEPCVLDLKAMDAGKPFDPSARWQEAIEAMGKPEDAA